MSEPDMMDPLEPTAVNKDPMLVNGSPDDIPPLQDPVLVKQPMEPVNGLDHNGLEHANEEGTPVNGDVVHEDLVDDNDLMGNEDNLMGNEDNLMGSEDIVMEGGGESDIVLPPPPEDMSGFPPPLQQQEVDLVEPAAGLESEDNVVGEMDNEVVEDDLMGESIEGLPPVDNIAVDRVVDDVSEEELVSDEGVNEEHDLEKPISPVPAVAEQPQLIDFGGEQEVPDDVQQPGDNILDSPVPVETVMGGMGLAHELAPEPVPLAPEPVMQEDIPPEPQEPVEVEPEPLPVVEPEGSSVDPEPVAEVVPEPEPVCQEPILNEPEPSHEVVTEMPQQAEEPVQEVVPVVQPEPVKEVVHEPEVEEINQDIQDPELEVSKDVENDYVPNEPVIEQPPDIIAQTTEEPHEVDESPPPPPPPLVDGTPPPPPPLDDSIQLKREHRRSGEVTPTKKESPTEPPAVHVHEATPVAVVAPVMKQESEPEPRVPVCPVPVPVPVPQSEPSVAAPAPVVEENDRETGEGQGSVTVSPMSSPARSEGAGSEAEPQELASPKVSQKINKKNFKNKIKFHVDLLDASIKQLSFLSTVNKQTSLQEEWLYKQAIRRYEAFWLPLAAEHKKEHLAAPLDIEWVWHCHMLAPVCYEADCTSIVGKVVDHKIYSEKDRTKALEKSRKYWTAKYPNEPFEIELVYKEKVEQEQVDGPNKAQESEGKEDSIPFVEEGTSEIETKG